MSSPMDWEKQFRDQLKDIAWSHLSRLGAPTNVSPDESLNVDPESLVVFVMRIGRNDSRLFRETMDWSREFDDVLSKMRFKRIIKRTKPANDTMAVLGGLFQTLDEADSTRQSWTSLVNYLRDNHDSVDGVTVGESTSKDSKNNSKIFAEWGVICPDFFRTRDPVEFLDEARETWIQSNDRLRLRKLIANIPRAEVVNFLVHGGVGNSNSIAQELNLSQPQVHTILRDLRESGLVKSWEDGRSRIFALAGETDECHFIDEGEVFVNWEFLFKALGGALDQVTRQREKDLSHYQLDKLQNRIHEQFIQTIGQSEYLQWPDTDLYDRVIEDLNTINPESRGDILDKIPPESKAR